MNTLRKIGLILGILIVLFTGLAMVTVKDTKVIHAKALTDHECDDTEYHFVITQISERALAPPINVNLGGVRASIGVIEYTGKTAHYIFPDTNVEAIDAWATIYNDWDGQFNLSHGPCFCPKPTPTPTDPPPTPTPTDPPPTPTPTDDPTPTPTDDPTPTNTPEEPTPTPTNPPRKTSTPTPWIPETGDGPAEGKGLSSPELVLTFIAGLFLTVIGLGIFKSLAFMK